MLYDYHTLNKLAELIAQESNWLKEQLETENDALELELPKSKSPQKEAERSVNKVELIATSSIEQLLSVVENTIQETTVQTPSEKKLISEDIAIIGMSGRFPQARDVETFWKNLKIGKNCISEVPTRKWNTKDYYSCLLYTSPSPRDS